MTGAVSSKASGGGGGSVGAYPVRQMMELVERHMDRVDIAAIAPTVQWRSRASVLKTANAESDASFLVV